MTTFKVGFYILKRLHLFLKLGCIGCTWVGFFCIQWELSLSFFKTVSFLKTIWNVLWLYDRAQGARGRQKDMEEKAVTQKHIGVVWPALYCPCPASPVHRGLQPSPPSKHSGEGSHYLLSDWGHLQVTWSRCPWSELRSDYAALARIHIHLQSHTPDTGLLIIYTAAVTEILLFCRSQRPLRTGDML